MKDKISAYKDRTQQILDSEYLTTPTKKVLKERMEKKDEQSFFDRDSFNLLSVICDLLVDQDINDPMVDIALYIDQRLQNNDSDGWRYDCMPPDRDMYMIGLKAIDSTAIKSFENDFRLLAKEQQMKILSSIQKGDVDQKIWGKLDPKLFFEDLLAETTEIFFSDPVAQTSINYVGMADAKGWTKLKLNQEENLETLKTKDERHSA